MSSGNLLGSFGGYLRGERKRSFGKIHRYDKGKNTCLINIDVGGETYLHRLACVLYCFNECYIFR